MLKPSKNMDPGTKNDIEGFLVVFYFELIYLVQTLLY
jgi:hypothetical protein